MTRFVRSLGDPVTRLDRTEPALNEALPGDPRDTTTPAAMAADLRKMALGPVLSPGSRDRLCAWMTANTTGTAKLRAGVPQAWRVGDKTGTGERGTSNDVRRDVAAKPGSNRGGGLSDRGHVRLRGGPRRGLRCSGDES